MRWVCRNRHCDAGRFLAISVASPIHNSKFTVRSAQTFSLFAASLSSLYSFYSHNLSILIISLFS
jgi:hypothetical protein